MRKIYAQFSWTAPAKQLKHAFALAMVFTITLSLTTISPSKLFAAAPTITSFSPAIGPVGTLVTINGTNLSTPTAFTIGGKSAIVVSNTGSVLVAMVMTGATTGAVSITTAGGTASGSGSFTITATKYPSGQQGDKLVGTGNTAAASQGNSVAVSADGNTAVVGGYTDNSGIGGTWVYTRSGATWVQQGTELIGTGGAGTGNQGYAVAVSADGNTFIEGGFQANGGVGAAWVFTRSGSTWTQQGSALTGTGAVGQSAQGASVSISADGNTAMVGGYTDNTQAGAAWVFTRSGGTWTQQGAKLVGTGATASAEQGISVSLSADGNTAIVGGWHDNSTLGAAWIFVRSAGTWTQQGTKLVSSDNVDNFVEQGGAVFMSADGNTAIVGGSEDNTNQGAAWVYVRSGSTWTQQGSKLVGTDNTGEASQGISVSLSADGNTAIVGGYQDNSFIGATWVYTRSGGAWAQQGSKLVGTGGTGAGGQGNFVSMSADATTAIVGGPFDNTSQGAVWVFATPPTITSFSPATGPPGTLVTINGTGLSAADTVTIGGQNAVIISNTGNALVTMVMPGTSTGTVSVTTAGGSSGSSGNFTPTATPYPTVQQGSKLVGTGNTGPAQQGHAMAVSADGNTAIVGGFADNSSQGAAWIYTRSGTTWVQQGTKLVGTGNMGAAQQGWSVAISADGNTAIVGGYQDNSSVGAAWIFTRSGSTWTQQGSKLVGMGGMGTQEQGISVSLSADGNTAILGGSQDNSGIGAVWVFTRSAGAWTQQGLKLVGTGGSGSQDQGASVSLSADGNTAIVGGNFDNNFQGAAWIFTRSGSTWTQQGSKLVGTDKTGIAGQGVSVSLSADGNTALVGGSGDNSSIGAAWIYVRNAGVWAQQGTKLVGTGNVGASSQGSFVSLSADGNTAIVGGYGDNANQGAAWVYSQSGGAWLQKGSKLVGTGNTGAASQGYSVALSADGRTTIAGGPIDNSSQGAAWVYFTGHPAITSFSPATGPPGTLITVNGTNLGGPTAFTIGGQTAIVVSNTGSVLVAMVMPGTVTGVISITSGGGTASGSGNFTVTATKYPAVQQGSKLLETGNTGTAFLGYSVALSADGNTAIVGGFGDNAGQGAAWVYTRSGGTWAQQGSKLLGTGSVGTASQGNSVALSADGNTAIVGGYQDNSGVGAAWVYTRSGSTWTQQGSKLVGTDNVTATGEAWKVSLSADGNTALISSFTENADEGAVWVFTRSGGIWTQQGSKLVGTGALGVAWQGNSVSLSADGNTAIEGGFNDNTRVGAAWVFTRTNGAWTQQGSKLAGTGTAGASGQGASVALSADGNTAIVGATGDNSGAGAVWVFTRSSTTWTQQGQKLVGTGSTGAAQQGRNISLSADGNTAVIGGSFDNSSVGAAWVFTRSGAAWAQKGTKLAGTGYVGAPMEGAALALSSDGTTAILGGEFDNSNSGAAWVFIPASNNASLSTIKLNPYSSLVNAGTVGATTTYTTSAVNSTASVTVTATTADPTAAIKVNGTTVTSGTASGSIALAEGTTTTINTVVTAQDGTTTKTYSIVVTRAPSSNASLSTIALTPYSSLTNTGTVGTTTTYTTSVVNATASVKVTPTAGDPNATIKVNGVTVTSGTASGSITLAEGTTTTINTVVTAQDGTTNKTYSIVVTRAPSSNASLSTIALTPYSSLTNTGTVGTTTTYTTSVVNATASVKVTPSAGDANAIVKVNGVAVTSGAASGSIALAEGTTTTINTIVTAQDGTTTKTYSIVVTRAPSSNASLGTIALTPYSTLTNTGTVGATTSYTTSVSNATTSVKVTPTTGDANATVKVNGAAVTSGTASGSIALAVGSNVINTVVTAQDGTTTRTYSITVTRATGPLMSLYLPISVIQPTEMVTIGNDGVMVHQGVSPNGDGINDFLTIDGLAAYPDNRVTIVDRGGAIIFEAKGYNNISKVFDGHSSVSGRLQQPGTYFYSIDYIADGQSKRKTGYIILKY